MPWNSLADQRPAAVALPADEGAVVAVVRAATDAGLRVAPQSTGHGAGAMPDLTDVVLVRTEQMSDLSIDAATARVGAGVRWLDVVEAAASRGLGALHGSAPSVGVVGFSLGGGIGWYGRSLGLQCNSVTSVDLMLPDGSRVRADADHEPELFWAVRGGGGSFGIVTAIEFRLHPIATTYAGFLLWDWRDAERVLRRYAQWAPSAPDEVTTAFRIMQVPRMPDIPEVVRGRQIAIVDGAVLADDETAERILAPLRELKPEVDTFRRVPVDAVSRLHMDPDRPTPSVTDTALLADLPPAGVDALLPVAGPDSGTSLLMPAELRQLGGAFDRAEPSGGALSRLPGRFLLSIVGVARSPEEESRARGDVARVTTAMAPFGDGRRYLNFVDHPVDPSAGHDEATWTRLRRLRSSVDPGGLLVANHTVPPG